MTTFLIVLLVFTLLCFLLLIWALICNDMTWRQRNAIIDYIYGGGLETWASKCEARIEYDYVSYNKHWFTLMLLRDYKKLYPETYRLMEKSDYLDRWNNNIVKG